MKLSLSPVLPACLLGAALLVSSPAFAADNATAPADTNGTACGKLVGANSSNNASNSASNSAGSPNGLPNGTDAGFALRDGEAVDFVSNGQTTHGKLLVFNDGSLFRAYWQPQGSEEKYALANAGPHGVRLVSTPPQGTPATDGKPGITTQPMQVLSCPKL